jgi:capsular polysaccharide export protein
MVTQPPPSRVFLFLQGPHGPFFGGLARMLRKAGCTTWRVGFNAGDRAFWRDGDSYIPYQDTPENWPAAVAAMMDERAVTDIVLYGDTRPIHAHAVREAKERNITVHVFEEGYLRPYWVTYERSGTNGNSRLMDMSVDDMRSALAESDIEAPLPPAHWGDMRHHVFYGALYHWFVMFANRKYRNFKPHRALPVAQEFQLYLKRLVLMPALALDRRVATFRIRNGGFPYHLVLLQLEHDSSFQEHSPFTKTSEFLSLTLESFAKGAPKHHHLVFKAHPLEDGRAPIRKDIKRISRELGIANRVHYVRGGKLAKLLDEARSAVTVNSTAGQQVLWRNIPIKLFGRAVYDKPEFVSNLSLSEFFAGATRPDNKAYVDFRRFLMETSQVPGGFYSMGGRRQLMRQVVDMILSNEDPYDALHSGKAAPRQQLRLVN